MSTIVTGSAYRRGRQRIGGTVAAGGGAGVPAFGTMTTWFDFSDPGTLTVDGSSNLLTISDKIGSAVATKSGSGSILPRTIRGRQGYGPNGTSSNLMMSVASVTALAQPYTFSFVNDGLGSYPSGVVFHMGSGGLQVFTFGTWTANAGGNVNGGASNTAAHIHFIIVNGASSQWYIDNVLVGSGNLGAGAVATTGMLFNSFPGGGNQGSRSLGELAIGGGVPDATARNAEYARMLDRWPA